MIEEDFREFFSDDTIAMTNVLSNLRNLLNNIDTRTTVCSNPNNITFEICDSIAPLKEDDHTRNVVVRRAGGSARARYISCK